MNDVVKNPSHYCDGRKYEPKDIIRLMNLNFNLGNTVKYISRAGRKDDIVQDLSKAMQYITFEIDYLALYKTYDYAEGIITTEVLNGALFDWKLPKYLESAIIMISDATTYKNTSDIINSLSLSRFYISKYVESIKEE